MHPAKKGHQRLFQAVGGWKTGWLTPAGDFCNSHDPLQWVNWYKNALWQAVSLQASRRAMDSAWNVAQKGGRKRGVEEFTKLIPSMRFVNFES